MIDLIGPKLCKTDTNE